MMRYPSNPTPIYLFLEIFAVPEKEPSELKVLDT
jgi:hypothetical protein